MCIQMHLHVYTEAQSWGFEYTNIPPENPKVTINLENLLKLTRQWAYIQTALELDWELFQK